MALLSTQVSIGLFSPNPIQLDLEALAVLRVLDSIRGHLDKMVRGYAASELQKLEEFYPNYRNVYRTIAVVPYQQT